MVNEIIVYTAQWCKKCKMLKNELLDQLQRDTPDFTWSYIDVDEMDESEDGPDSIPYVIVKIDGKTTNLIGYNEIIQSLEMSLISTFN
jgi:thiol-disulfide isomerase/thioredoxin|tara:strand:+ start:299 stop:562 length:264 start_codon:yes stop_codon:yes gene_type:complete